MQYCVITFIINDVQTEYVIFSFNILHCSALRNKIRKLCYINLDYHDNFSV